MRKNCKKETLISLTALLCLGLMIGCGSGKDTNTGSTGESSRTDLESHENGDEKVTINSLRLCFTPSREPDEILHVTEPLKVLLKDALANEGYDIGKIDITVATSYDAVGEAVSAGTADVGFMPGGTFVLYEDGSDVLMTSLDPGFPVDSDDPKMWNDAAPIVRDPEDPTVRYRALLLTGPSEKGRELAAKVNAGQELSWEDIDSANWSFMSSSSPAGYIYPSLWMAEHYGKSLLDLSHAVQSDSYGSAFARLASGQIDALCTYADCRIEYAEKWNKEYGRESSIWDETAVIGVTPAIYNDTISVSKNSPVVDDAFKTAFCNAIIAIGEIPEGKEALGVYGHIGYQPAQSSDYDSERAAQKMLLELSFD